MISHIFLTCITMPTEITRKKYFDVFYMNNKTKDVISRMANKYTHTSYYARGQTRNIRVREEMVGEIKKGKTVRFKTNFHGFLNYYNIIMKSLYRSLSTYHFLTYFYQNKYNVTLIYHH